MKPELREQLNRNSCGSAIEYIESLERALADAVDAPATTPAAKWRENGEPDPFGNGFNGERAQLCCGKLTDDEMANAVFLNPGIGNLTGAKERIRWLSRRFVDICNAHDALAEHVKALKKACRTAARLESRSGNYSKHIEALDLATEKLPTTNLAKRDAAAFEAGAKRILEGLGSQSVEQAAAEYAERVKRGE